MLREFCFATCKYSDNMRTWKYIYICPSSFSNTFQQGRFVTRFPTLFGGSRMSVGYGIFSMWMHFPLKRPNLSANNDGFTTCGVRGYYKTQIGDWPLDHQLPPSLSLIFASPTPTRSRGATCFSFFFLAKWSCPNCALASNFLAENASGRIAGT